MLRIGIYGGAFAPIHKGHIEAAKAFMKQMWLDMLFIVPTGESPHKEMDKSATSEDRLEMCRIAFDGIEGIVISDTEIKREGKSYSIDTLRELSGDDRRLFMLCGTDMILTLDDWDGSDEIFKLCYPVYIRREQDSALDKVIIEKLAKYQHIYHKNVVKINAPVIEVSSSEIRRRLKAGEDTSEFMHPEVLEYIKKKGLYT
ncbi:MAG: nicotinate (nicotinamide) nucleotide adenylyltransferase [Ruminococcaceae bacterium]|nr:nicotinate (nicotinamide) nucleotide adenylyltransferase [Oscillospiraceae bacterium]